MRPEWGEAALARHNGEKRSMPTPSATREYVVCPECRARVRRARLEGHLLRVHQKKSTVPGPRKPALRSSVAPVASLPTKTLETPKKPQPAAQANPRANRLFDPTLWGRPSEEAELAWFVVVGPYPTSEFFRHVRENLAPNQTIIVADDGCPRETAERIEAGFAESDGGAVGIRYATGLNSEFLHAKLYWADWQVQGRTTGYCLAWGSANASQSGFGTNAEAMSFVALEPGQHKLIENYFALLTGGRADGRVGAVDYGLPGGVRVLLPGFGFTSTPEPETFEGWIQSGRLCHKYEPDQTFARLALNLKKPLPRDSVRDVFSRAGLGEETKSQTFRYPYVGDPPGDDKTENAQAPPWRSQYFLESWLGFWTSSECYQECGNLFVAQNEEQRNAILGAIREAGGKQHKTWIDDFLGRLRQVLDGLKEKNLNPKLYLEMRGSALDEDHYRSEARQVLLNHQKRAAIPVFADRFRKGYVFPPIPPFRGVDAVDGGSFTDFVHSLCQSVLHSLAKQRCMSKIVQQFRGQFDRLGTRTDEMAAEELHRFITDNWATGAKIGKSVKDFFRS